MPQSPVECEAGGCGKRLYPPTVGAGCDLGNHLNAMRSTNCHTERGVRTNVRIIFQGEGSDTIQKMHCVVTLTGNIKEGQ
jgi:hypothetical protein